MNKNVVIAGNGGQAAEAAFILRRMNEVTGDWNFLGFVDEVPGDGVWGDDERVIRMEESLCVIIAVGEPSLRKKIHEKLKINPNVFFPNLIDPSAMIDEQKSRLGNGNLITQNCVISPGAIIGDFNLINVGSYIAHDVMMGAYNTIGPGSQITGNVSIGNRVNIGAGTVTKQGICIASDVVTGAGCVVVRDIDEAGTYVGVPARRIDHT